MVEAEFVLAHLRQQVGVLQAAITHLEAHDGSGPIDYDYLQTILRGVMTQLEDVERFSARHGRSQVLRAEWLN